LNTFSKFLLSAVSCVVTTVAQADTTYSADFTLQDNTLPRLRIEGSPVWTRPDSLPGEWSYGQRIDATVNSRDLLSSTVNPATGALEQTWGQQNHSDNNPRAGGPPFSMGESHANIPGPNDWSHTISTASVALTGLQADVTLTDRYANADSHATWSRDFSLDAHSSFTFSGLATVGITGDSNPLSAATTFDSNDSFASLTLGDLFGRVRTTIGADIWGIGPGLGNIFSYSVGPGGLLALTVTNNSESSLRGTFNAGSYVAVSAPIPEPETWLLLLTGAGIVGVAARKRHASLVRS